MKRGILGIPKDPKNQTLFSFDQRFGDDWPSSDSDDSDYKPGSPSDADDITLTCKAKCREGKKADNGSADSAAHCADVSSCHDAVHGDLWGKCIPHLVLLKIFYYVVASSGAVPFLCRVRRVCRLWHQCADDSTLWQSVDLSYGWIKANDETMQFLCQTRFSKKLTCINLSNWKSLTVNGLKLLVDTCPQLKSVNLSYCKVNSPGVLYMINKCSQLAEIDLTAYGSAAVVSPKTVVHIVNTCSGNLRSLNLSRNPPKGYNAVLKALATCCPNLECLDLSRYPDSSIPLSFNIEQLQHGCPKLCILRLVNANIVPSHVSVHDRSASESPGFPELKELSLRITTSTSVVSVAGYNGILHRLVKKSEKLKLLDLHGCSQVTSVDLLRVPATDLAELYVSGCSVVKDEEMEILLAKWQHSLVTLDVSWNVHTETVLNMAMTRLASSSVTSKLEVLDLRGSQISLSTVQTLLKGCPLLHNLNLSSCRCLPRGMKREYFNESLDNLRKNIDSA